MSAEFLRLGGRRDTATSGGQVGPNSDGRALVILLGLALSTMEARTKQGRLAWTNRNDEGIPVIPLDEHGYPLSDIELEVLGRRKADAPHKGTMAVAAASHHHRVG